jgi:peptidyl-prolyl cis-trans isomerase A (cyclophilin A)
MFKNIAGFSLLFSAIAVIGCSGNGNTVDDPAVPEAPGLQQPMSLYPYGDKAPDVYSVKLETTKGDIIIEVNRDWAPVGADHFYNLVTQGFYTDCAFFRVLPGFMAQTGVNGDPKIHAQWGEKNIPDDPQKKSNLTSYVSFGQQGRPNSRSTHIFINTADNVNLDAMGFPPFGIVTSGMDVANSLYNGYGEGAPRGAGPDQGRMAAEGSAYLKADYPKLDYILKAGIVGGAAEGSE